jgi:hypothetical protein
MTDTTTGVTVALVYAALFAAHGLGDVWVQRHRHVLAKGDANWHGQLACAIHVTTYTVTTALAVLGVMLAPFGTHITWAGFAAGQAFSAITHYAIDRRWTLLQLAILLGKRDFHDLGAQRDLMVVACKPVLDTTPSGQVHGGHVDVVVPLDNAVHATGANSLDQTLHLAALFVSALLTALVSTLI